MSSNAGPDMITDGLVFKYDTGSGKSYKGEPTENIFLNPTFIGTAGTQTSTVTDNWVFSGYTGDTGFKFQNNSSATIPLRFTGEGALITTGASPDNQNRRFYYTGNALEAGAEYTVSAWIYTTYSGGVSIAHFEYGGDNLNSGYFPNVNSHSNFAVGEWFYWEDTYTVGADYSTGYLGPVVTGSRDNLFAFQRFQIEKKSHATPFVNGTRSATQGLLDLTGNSTIDLSDASFDSNAQMTFGSSNQDRLRIPNNDSLQFGTDSFTAAAWIYPTSVSNVRIVNNRGTGSGGSYKGYQFKITESNNQWYFYDASIDDASGNYKAASFSSNKHDKNKWYYVNMVYETQNELRFYVNGVLDGTVSVGSYGSITNNLPTAIGAAIANNGTEGTYSQHFGGKIVHVALYNRALTAKEVLQNYQATKSRFS